jgi:hypothetical protein
MALYALKGDCHPIYRDGALQCFSIVARRNVNCEFHRGSGKKPVLYQIRLKEYSFENGRPTAYRIRVHNRHQLGYLVDPVCDQKAAD